MVKEENIPLSAYEAEKLHQVLEKQVLQYRGTMNLLRTMGKDVAISTSVPEVEKILEKVMTRNRKVSQQEAGTLLKTLDELSDQVKTTLETDKKVIFDVGSAFKEYSTYIKDSNVSVATKQTLLQEMQNFVKSTNDPSKSAEMLKGLNVAKLKSSADFKRLTLMISDITEHSQRKKVAGEFGRIEQAFDNSLGTSKEIKDALAKQTKSGESLRQAFLRAPGQISGGDAVKSSAQFGLSALGLTGLDSILGISDRLENVFNTFKKNQDDKKAEVVSQQDLFTVAAEEGNKDQTKDLIYSIDALAPKIGKEISASVAAQATATTNLDNTVEELQQAQLSTNKILSDMRAADIQDKNQSKNVTPVEKEKKKGLLSMLGGGIGGTLGTASSAIASGGSKLIGGAGGMLAKAGPWALGLAAAGGVIGGLKDLGDKQKAIARYGDASASSRLKTGAAGALSGLTMGLVSSETMAKVVDAIVAGVKALFSKDFWIKIWDGLKPVLSGMWDGMKTLGSLLWDGIKAIVPMISEGIKMIPGLLWDGIKGIGSLLWTGIKLYFTDFVPFVASILWDGIKALGKGLAFLFLDLPLKLGGLVWDGLKAIPGLVWDGISFLVSELPKMLISGISDLAGWLGDSLASVGKSMIGVVGEYILAPFGSGLQEVGQFIAGVGPAVWGFISDYILKPIEDGLSLVGGLLSAGWDLISSPIKAIFSSIVSGIDLVVDYLGNIPIIGSAIKAGWQTAKTTGNSAVAMVASTASAVGTAATSGYQAAKSGVGNAMAATSAAVGGAITVAGSAVSQVAKDAITWSYGKARAGKLNPGFKSKLEKAAGLYKQKTGKNLVIGDTFRSHEEQETAFRNKPGLAAPPGKSMHEFGYAVDMNSQQANEMGQLGILNDAGLARPMFPGRPGGKVEPWHVEPVEIQGKYAQVRGRRSADVSSQKATKVAPAAPPPPEPGDGAVDKADATDQKIAASADIAAEKTTPGSASMPAEVEETPVASEAAAEYAQKSALSIPAITSPDAGSTSASAAAQPTAPGLVPMASTETTTVQAAAPPALESGVAATSVAGDITSPDAGSTSASAAAQPLPLESVAQGITATNTAGASQPASTVVVQRAAPTKQAPDAPSRPETINDADIMLARFIMTQR